MTEQWLIDGYNLFHRFPGKNWVERLASFAAAKQCPVILVLDGVGNDAEFEKSKTRFFSVIYSQGSSADCAIERYLFQHPDRRSFTVVTDDRTITDISLGLGARVMKNKSFVVCLKESEESMQDILWNEKTKAHGFHRPLDQKLREKGFLD